MVTAEEIGEIALFAGLGPEQRERLSRVPADISLVPGEYAAHEGERARAVRGARGPHRAGQARRRDRAGRRRRGIRATSSARCRSSLGTVFPVGFRAAEPSRVMRIEPHDYHAIAAVAPDVGAEVGDWPRTG